MSLHWSADPGRCSSVTESDILVLPCWNNGSVQIVSEIHLIGCLMALGWFPVFSPLTCLSEGYKFHLPSNGDTSLFQTKLFILGCLWDGKLLSTAQRVKKQAVWKQPYKIKINQSHTQTQTSQYVWQGWSMECVGFNGCAVRRHAADAESIKASSRRNKMSEEYETPFFASCHSFQTTIIKWKQKTREKQQTREKST